MALDRRARLPRVEVPDLDDVVRADRGQDVFGGRVEFRERRLAKVAGEVHQRLGDVLRDAAVRYAPHFARAVLGRGRDHVIVEGREIKVQHGPFVPVDHGVRRGALPGLVVRDHGEGATAGLDRDGEVFCVALDVVVIARRGRET